MPFRRALATIFFLGAAIAKSHAGSEAAIPPRVIVSVHDQKLILVENGEKLATYPVSTSKFGLGDRWGSMATPLGYLQVAQKIGDHAVPGQVIKKRRYTGEVLAPNAPGRDPIVSRIIWLRGLEKTNANSFNRCIYIHGTTEERLIGKPVSYGCVRMRSSDVVALYNQIDLGALVEIIPDALPKIPAARHERNRTILTGGPKVEPGTKAPGGAGARKTISANARPGSGGHA
jgi:lipoprotein-anchoring transpeptidase ErfK/SrfK